MTQKWEKILKSSVGEWELSGTFAMIFRKPWARRISLNGSHLDQWFQTVVLLRKNVSEFLDSELKSVMQEGWSYIKDSGDFIKKLKNIDHISQDANMVTADVVGLYPFSPHDAGLEALRKALDNRENKNISTDLLCISIGDCYCYQIVASIRMYIYGPSWDWISWNTKAEAFSLVSLHSW